MTVERALVARGLRPSTARRYAIFARRLAASGLGVEAWLAALSDSQVGPALAALRAVAEVCPELGTRPDAGVVRLARRRDRLAQLRRRRPVAGPADLAAALGRAEALTGLRRTATLTALRLAGLAGLRAGDVRRLRWRDLDLASGHVVLPDPKGGRPCRLPLAPSLLAWLRGVRGRPDEAVATTRADGEPVSASTFWRLLKRVGVTPHALRRGFATVLLDRGVPLVTVSKLLNHASPNTTFASYYRPGDDVLSEAVASLEDGKETP